MRVLVYKRTHNGDPDKNGCFGVYDCMGIVRDRDFDAVIGVGGIGHDANVNEIAGKVNWIGIRAHKNVVLGKRGPIVTFDHFLDFGTDGQEFRELAPTLAERMYSHNVRHLVVDGSRKDEYREAMLILALADEAPPSLGRTVSSDRDRCVTRRMPRRCT